MSENNEPIFSVLTNKGSYTVSGAGDTEFNGTYTEAGIHEGHPYYQFDSYYLFFDVNYFDSWALAEFLDDTPFYIQDAFGDSSDPRTSYAVWETAFGGSPPPTVT